MVRDDEVERLRAQSILDRTAGTIVGAGLHFMTGGVPCVWGACDQVLT